MRSLHPSSDSRLRVETPRDDEFSPSSELRVEEKNRQKRSRQKPVVRGVRRGQQRRRLNLFFRPTSRPTDVRPLMKLESTNHVPLRRGAAFDFKSGETGLDRQRDDPPSVFGSTAFRTFVSPPLFFPFSTNSRSRDRVGGEDEKEKKKNNLCRLGGP